MQPLKTPSLATRSGPRRSRHRARLSRGARTALLATIAALGGLSLLSCQTAAPPSGYGGSQGFNRPEPADAEAGSGPLPSPARAAEAPSSRPGLGTGWGEDRDSSIRYSDFKRGSRSRPEASGRLYYNDDTGARAMARHDGFAWRSSGPVDLADRTVAVGLKDSRGRWLKSFSTGSDRFFVGEAGDRYSVSVRNRSRVRIEVVVSVDGLDVMDGKSASTSKRGYLVAPGGEVDIEGFRQSEDRVAAFRFSSVDQSYSALKHGSTRNVGVIGIAVFTENGSDPWRSQTSRDDIERRRSAVAFPGSRFATAP